MAATAVAIFPYPVNNNDFVWWDWIIKQFLLNIVLKTFKYNLKRFKKLKLTNLTL